MGAVETLKEQVGLTKRPATFMDKLESMKGQIAMALPRHLTPERMIRIAITCVKTNPKLLECETQSILAAVMLASQLGLEPGVLGQCFLVPYKKNCTLVPGWLGFLDLVNRAGKATAWTGAVYQGDVFDWALGDKPYVIHRPCGDETTMTHCYAIARTKGSDFPIIEVWPVEKIWRHRDRFNKVGASHYSYAHPEMYGKKVALLQVLKYVPRSVELATAFRLDSDAEMGEQNLKIDDVKNVIDGTLVQSVPEATPETAEPERAQPSKKEDDAICNECRRKLTGEGATGHHHLCPYVTKEAKAEPQATPESVSPFEAEKTSAKPENVVAVLVTKVAVRKAKPYRILSVTDGANLQYDISVWHEHLFPILDEVTGKSCIFEVSYKDKDGRTYTNLEHVLEVAGVEYKDDKAAEEEF
jgi:recombination protein RecT